MDVEQYMSDNNANKYTLDGIPEEIVVHILSFLSPKQLCDVLTISHKWKEIGEDSSLWRRLCEIRFLTDSDETIEDKDQSNNNNNNSKDWKRIFASRSQLWKRITANYLTHTDESLTDIFSVVNEDETKCPLRAMYTGWDHFGNSSSTVGVVQAVKQAELFPFGSFPFVYYFEITVINSGNSGFIGCGLAPSGYKQAEPGWKSRSYGYHGDDGRIYSNSGWGTHWNDTWGTGDTIGCLVNLVTKEIQYTKNGFLLGTAFRNVVVDFFHATVGLHSAREEVEFNFGAKSFQFDLVHYIQMELQKYQETNLYKEYAAKVCVQPASETPITPEEDEPLSLLMKRLQEYDPERDDNDDEFANELRHLVRALGLGEWCEKLTTEGAGRETINTEDMPVSELRMLVRILMMFQVANRQEQDQEPQEEEHDIVDMDSEPEQPNQ